MTNPKPITNNLIRVYMVLKACGMLWCIGAIVLGFYLFMFFSLTGGSRVKINADQVILFTGLGLIFILAIAELMLSIQAEKQIRRLAYIDCLKNLQRQLIITVISGPIVLGYWIVLSEYKIESSDIVAIFISIWLTVILCDYLSLDRIKKMATLNK